MSGLGRLLPAAFEAASVRYRCYLVIGGRSAERPFTIRFADLRDRGGSSDATVRQVAPAIVGDVHEQICQIGGAAWAMACSGGRSKGRFFVQVAQAQLELLLVCQTLGWLPSRTKPAQQVVRKAYPTLLFLLCPVKPATIGPPVHPWRLAREGVDDARPATEQHSGFPDAPNASIMRALGLARIGKPTTLTTGKARAVGIQHCNPPPAALTFFSIGRAQKPRTSAAAVATRPRD